MAYRELGVIEIREVLRRFCLGDGLHAIARGTGSDRKTVGKYVAAALAAGLRRGDAGPTDEQVLQSRADNSFERELRGWLAPTSSSWTTSGCASSPPSSRATSMTSSSSGINTPPP